MHCGILNILVVFVNLEVYGAFLERSVNVTAAGLFPATLER